MCGYHPPAMNKFLFLVVVGVLLYLIVTRAKRGPREKPGAPAAPESMIQCAYCGVHLPQSESLPAGGRRYCCEEHRRLGQG